MYRGVFKVTSRVKTRQVREIWPQQKQPFNKQTEIGSFTFATVLRIWKTDKVQNNIISMKVVFFLVGGSGRVNDIVYIFGLV